MEEKLGVIRRSLRLRTKILMGALACLLAGAMVGGAFAIHSAYWAWHDRAVMPTALMAFDEVDAAADDQPADDGAGAMQAVDGLPGTPFPVGQTGQSGATSFPAPGISDPPSASPPPATPVRKPHVNPAPRVLFDGRPIRKVGSIRVLATAYSPDKRSCGPNARGITASGKSVWTNAMMLVAADTRLLPFGSLVSLPGYNAGKPVPVLDRGSAIKGRRIDVLFPTHAQARAYGKKNVTITVWDYDD